MGDTVGVLTITGALVFVIGEAVGALTGDVVGALTGDNDGEAEGEVVGAATTLSSRVSRRTATTNRNALDIFHNSFSIPFPPTIYRR